ncbi:MAG: O-methyltransferase [Actinobacteria bacterium]|nr:O-methyltransferase [Actinomycetota bacterium]
MDVWTSVDNYFASTFAFGDAPAAAALVANQANGLPPIDIAPNQGALFGLLARSIGARRILEVGTLGGYSTIWLAGALPPGGRLVTLELDRDHAALARDNIAAAGLAERVDVRVGPAGETLAEFIRAGSEPFDLSFIDADKAQNVTYFEAALHLSRPGALIVVDNVVRGGAVVDVGSDDPNVRGTRALFDHVGQDSRVEATAIQTVGAKGYDGFLLARVR